MKPTAITNLVTAGIGTAIKDIFTKASFVLNPMKYDSAKGTLVPDEKISFSMDALVQESEQRSISVTNYPLEGGGEFAEHAQQLAFTLNVSGIISDSSFSYIEAWTPTGALGGSAIGRLAGLESKTQKAYDLLTRWAETGQPLQVRTKYKKSGYVKTSKAGTNPVPFVIESFSHSRSKDTGQAISVSLSLREIRMVKLKSSAATNLPFIGKVSSGSDSASPGGPTQNAKSASAAESNSNSVKNGYRDQKAYFEKSGVRR